MHFIDIVCFMWNNLDYWGLLIKTKYCIPDPDGPRVLILFLDSLHALKL